MAKQLMNSDNIMETKDIEYLDRYEASLVDELVGLCTSFGLLDGELLASDDIDGKWKEFAPEYMAEAVPNLNPFPEAAIGWAGYIGMAVAKWWDLDWGRHHSEKYEALHGPRGFDDMDDHIMQDILGYGPPAGYFKNQTRAHRKPERHGFPHIRQICQGNVSYRCGHTAQERRVQVPESHFEHCGQERPSGIIIPFSGL